jgi:peptidoglycan/LPS O-acetylase OafA/YrhL
VTLTEHCWSLSQAMLLGLVVQLLVPVVQLLVPVMQLLGLVVQLLGLAAPVTCRYTRQPHHPNLASAGPSPQMLRLALLAQAWSLGR